MNKYIDTEKLISLLEQRKKQLARWTNTEYANQRIDEIDCILDVDIYSLPQEQSIKVYRVENEKEQKGLWRKFDGTWEPLFDMLTDGQCKDMPMEDNPIYREGGKQWFASAPSKETLQKWFSKKDLEELTAEGFTISEFEVVGHKKISDFEYIFTRDNIISRTYLKVSDIYPQEQSEIDLEKDVESWFFNEICSKINVEHTMYHYFQECARRYYELGRQSKLKVCEGLGNEIDRFRETEEYLLAERAGETDVVIARHFAKWGAEHRGSSKVPKDLEEAAEISFDEARALTEDYMYFLAKGLKENQPRPIGPHWFCEYAKNRFIAGAKWQAEQDQETIELAEDHAYFAGAVNEREKIMEEAVDEWVEKGLEIHPAVVEKIDGIDIVECTVNAFQEGQKVKLIIVKED